MFSNLKLWVVAALAIGLVAAGAAPAWYIQGLRWKSNVASIQQANIAALKTISDTAQAATAQALTQQQASEKSAAAAGAQYAQDIANNESEIETLRSALAAGTDSLQLSATCPSNPGSSNAVPNGSTGTGIVNATAPRLTDAAQSNYLILRQRIADADAQISGLQAYIKSLNQGATK